MSRDAQRDTRTTLTFFFRSGRRHYHGPAGNKAKSPAVEGDGDKGEKSSVDDKDGGFTVSHEIRN